MNRARRVNWGGRPRRFFAMLPTIFVLQQSQGALRAASACSRNVRSVGGTVTGWGRVGRREPCLDGAPPEAGSAASALEPMDPLPPGAVVHLVPNGLG